MDGVLIAARFALYADLAALAGLPLFWWSMGGSARRGVIGALAVGGFALSALWLLASAAGMAGTPLFSPDWSVVEILLKETPVGTVLAVRAVALLSILPLLFRRGGGWNAAIALPAAIAAATLAWSGHAAASEGLAGSAHRIADALHVLAAAGWFGALLALLGGVLAGREIGQTAAMLERFSLFGTLFVAMLIVTGAFNAVMIVGLPNLPALLHSRYGWLLLAKLALFGAMLLLAAANRWRLTPKLEAALEGGNTGAALSHLLLSLLMETSLAIIILGLVAALGTLDPLA
ncbi:MULTISPECIES: copper homeostasis membrane protein CopD [unclassified Sphingobium]|uniref:copper homeostasis membrane protein CopD n=1 Tax=unclassified Sphingobium TaxID=2611147 RepID=UPI0007705A35|nr:MULTISPECIES: copper homeostasis membrane protein CopD [unclassified Sphingobium]AMK23878.1 copper resistance D [Sphingobium sp. TKS]NML89348.1 copper homeostasis membrane protein CopD [Sphingobium sp. TB-6]